MPTNYTPNYHLNQWEPEDKVLRTDFNADNAKLDAALAEQSSTLKTLASQLSRFGNCKIYVAACCSYGFIPLPGKPELAFVVDENVHFILASPRLPKAMRYTPGAVASGSVSVSWSNSGLAVGSGDSTGAVPDAFVVAFYSL